jgi:Ca2+-binding RTX toxin-like protein
MTDPLRKGDGACLLTWANCERPTLKEIKMDLANSASKNTLTLFDENGTDTYITGKGKSGQTHTDTIYPTLFPGSGDWYVWDVNAGAADDVIDARGSTLPAFLYGGTGNDTIYGSMAYFNHIEGGDGNDLIDAQLVGTLETYPTGYTELLGGAGADTIYGGWGEDSIDGGAGRDIISAGAGDDWVVYDATDIRVEADGGRDTLDASSAAATNVRSGKGVTIDLSSSRDIFFNFENVIGSKFNDTLTGDNADNRFDGGAGNDTISAGGGNDFVVYDPNDTSVDGGFDWDQWRGFSRRDESRPDDDLPQLRNGGGQSLR